MEWADLTEEHTSRLLDTDTLLPPSTIGEPVVPATDDLQDESAADGHHGFAPAD